MIFWQLSQLMAVPSVSVQLAPPRWLQNMWLPQMLSTMRSGCRYTALYMMWSLYMRVDNPYVRKLYVATSKRARIGQEILYAFAYGFILFQICLSWFIGMTRFWDNVSWLCTEVLTRSCLSWYAAADSTTIGYSLALCKSSLSTGQLCYLPITRLLSASGSSTNCKQLDAAYTSKWCCRS